MTPPTPWTHSETAPPRKPRRLGLYLPYAIAAIVGVAWSLCWLWLANETQRHIDAVAAAERAAGGQAAWQARHVGGYPFRLDVDFTGLRLADASGWGVSIPVLKSEAYAFAPTRWVMFAPQGLSLLRPGDAPVSVTGRALRASVNGWDQHPPRISFEGDDLVFAVAPGGRPFGLARAASIQFYTRAGPDDQGAMLALVQGGVGPPGGWIEAFAPGRPTDLTLDAVFSHASRLDSRDWRSGVAAWTHAGGGLEVSKVGVAAGGRVVEARGGRLAPAADGALQGTLPARVTTPGQPTEAASLTFKADGAWLGPVRIAPPLRAY